MHRQLSKFGLAAVILFITSMSSADENSSLWRVTFDTNWLGPVETHLRIEKDADAVRATSLSGAVALLSELPGDHRIDDGLVVFEATSLEDGTYAGTIIAPWSEGALTLTIDGEKISGSVDGGAFNGSLTGARVSEVTAIRDYPAILATFDDVVASKIFAPEDLNDKAYLEFRKTLGNIAAVATDDFDLLFGFHWSWKNAPFSHFQLKRSHQSAEEMFGFFDQYRVGFEAATVEFDGDTAILKVRTMMGADTIEQIEAAYERIADQGSKTLIIDLRENSGGAFAVKPLVEHVIDEPLDAGFFLSQVWNRDHDQPPTAAEALAAPLWHGWSIASFWKDVQEMDILRVQFQPAEPNFDGDVFVLLDEKSASATELAADALRASGVATLVGRRTAGEMLSQSMFDVGEKFVVSLPVADYYSLKHGRIEGQGVPVDIVSNPAEALDVAQSLPSSHSN
jgi:carboxyl-terminal processing protease